MDLAELLRHVAEVGERLGLPYFVTGSTATIYYGEPRFTNDIDMVVELPPEQIVDLYAAFPETEFERRARLRSGADHAASFASPEDVILKKLESYLAGGSEKHLRDIAGVLRVSGERIDRNYIGEWAVRLGVDEVWEQVLRQLGDVPPPT